MLLKVIQQNYFHIAYSNQLIEHLHPDDAKIHVMNVRQILTKNGQYIFQTPHMFFGPHDVSVFFHNTPVGFHLKEYCNFELYFLLKKVGFTKTKSKHMLSLQSHEKLLKPVEKLLFLQ